MNKTLLLLSLQVSKHLRCFRLFVLTLLLCGSMQTMAETWTDANGLTWSFTVNGTEATNLKFYSGPHIEKVYLYGDPNRSEEEKAADPQLPFKPGAWDAAAMRFSSTEGAHLPTIPDNVYFTLKTLIFDVSDVSDDFDMKVMNGWWSNTYYDHVKWENGLNELKITETMANECAKGGEGRDLDLMLYSGSMTLNSVSYEFCSASGALEIPTKVYNGSTELTVTGIGNSAFYGFVGLTSVTIPKGVTNIDNNAFNGCTKLTSVNIPEGVTSIGDYAFSGCSKLTSVNIPSSVKYIGYMAFYKCSGLTSITVESGNTIYDSRDNCNAIIETATNTLMAGCNTTVIPNGVTAIDHFAFYNCSGLTSVTIPNGVTSIGNDAFYGCYNLTSVTIPNSVTRIGNMAFFGCTNLTSIAIPNSVTSIGGSAFASTGWYMKQSDGVLYLDNWLLGYKGNQPTGELVINEGTKGIADESLAYCSYLTSVTIPNSVTSIGYSAFYWCSALTSVTIGNSVTSIGEWAFSRCSALTSVTIPSSVTSIGDFAFYYCSAMTTVTSLIEKPFEINENVFMVYDDATYSTSFSSATLNVPAGTKSLYEATPSWNQFQNIVEMGEVEGIQSPIDHSSLTIDGYYTLDGCKIKGMPAKKGLYIVNGRKVVIQ